MHIRTQKEPRLAAERPSTDQPSTDQPGPTHRETTQDQLRAALRQRIAEIERNGTIGGLHKQARPQKNEDPTEITAPLPFGATDIDAHLPWGGLPVVGVHDIIEGKAIDGTIADDAGRGERVGVHGQMGGSVTAFIAVLLGALQRRNVYFNGVRPVLWIAPRRRTHENLYGPGLSAFGYDPFDAQTGLILVRARSTSQILWATEEGLRDPHLGAVIAEMPAGVLPSLTASRRLQLAAEAGGTLGILHVGGLHSALPPSASFTRWQITPAPTLKTTLRPTERRTGAGPPLYQERPRWRVDLLRCRGAAPKQWTVEWTSKLKSKGGQAQKTGQEMLRYNAKDLKSKNQKTNRTTCNLSMVSSFSDGSSSVGTEKAAESDPARHQALTG